jgi:hypothetical protein
MGVHRTGSRPYMSNQQSRSAPDRDAKSIPWLDGCLRIERVNAARRESWVDTRWLAAVVVSVLLIGMFCARAMADESPQRIVQAEDGTLYLLKNGVRYAIVGVPIGDEELDGYVDGGADGAALLLNASAAQEPAAASTLTDLPAAPPAENAAPATAVEQPATQVPTPTASAVPAGVRTRATLAPATKATANPQATPQVTPLRK